MFRGYAVALAAALLLSVSAEAKANKAVVRAIRGGAAEITTDGRSWKPAKVGQQLGENSAVKTDANAMVDLFLGDNGPVVRVTKDTTLGIDRLDVESTGIEKVIETQLDLRSGKILGNVKKMAAASKYEVKTPMGVAGIRGTEYAISADGRVQVFSGTVVVVYIVNNIPQSPITLQGPSESMPPVADGQAPRVTQISVTDPEIPTLTLGVTTNPDGTYNVFGLDPNGQPTDTIYIRTNPDGTMSVGRGAGGEGAPVGDVVVIVPSDQIPSNFDTNPEQPLPRLLGGEISVSNPGEGDGGGELID
jgi:hypothetical protein